METAINLLNVSALVAVMLSLGLKVKFVEVKTGITGSTDIEIKDGLKADDQIVIGSYKALRTLKNGATVSKEDVAAVPKS